MKARSCLHYDLRLSIARGALSLGAIGFSPLVSERLTGIASGCWLCYCFLCYALRQQY